MVVLDVAVDGLAATFREFGAILALLQRHFGRLSLTGILVGGKACKLRDNRTSEAGLQCGFKVGTSESRKVA